MQINLFILKDMCMIKTEKNPSNYCHLLPVNTAVRGLDETKINLERESETDGVQGSLLGAHLVLPLYYRAQTLGMRT